MVSTRRKSYQPSLSRVTRSMTPDPGDPPARGTRLRHNSLSTPPVAASPRRSRRASSLTPLESAGESAESAHQRRHRTKTLLERYRSEATNKLKVVEEEVVKAETDEAVAKKNSEATEEVRVGEEEVAKAEKEEDVDVGMDGEHPEEADVEKAAEKVAGNVTQPVAEDAEPDVQAVEKAPEDVEELNEEDAKPAEPFASVTPSIDIAQKEVEDTPSSAPEDVKEVNQEDAKPVEPVESVMPSIDIARKEVEDTPSSGPEDVEEVNEEDAKPVEPVESVMPSIDIAKKEVEDTSSSECENEEPLVSQEVDLRLQEGSMEEDGKEAAMEVIEEEEEEEVDIEGIDDKSAEQDAADAAVRKMAAAQRVLASVTEPCVPAPVAVAAPASTLTVAPTPTRIRPAPKPRGMAKSGRFWKSVRTRASKVVVRDSVSYEERMKKRQRQQAVRDLENQLKNERKQKLEDLRKRREYNTKKATENALKAEVYQVVKNPNKIKRMKKKQLRLLQKRDTTVVGKSVLDE